MVEIFWFESGALNGALAGNRSQFLRGKIFQLAAITSKGRTRPAHNCNIPWFQHCFSIPGFFPKSRDQKSSEWVNQTC
jgi:hypothetical protein